MTRGMSCRHYSYTYSISNDKQNTALNNLILEMYVTL